MQTANPWLTAPGVINHARLPATGPCEGSRRLWRRVHNDDAPLGR